MEGISKTSESYFCFPAEVYVSQKPCDIQTILGSCVAVCLYDKRRMSGGLNHYLLPLWEGEGLASSKYGNVAIEKLLDKMLILSDQRDLCAKIFGGASLMNLNDSVYRVGERNIQIAEDILTKYKIPVAGKSVGGHQGRKIIFNTSTGVALVKHLNANT